MTQQSALNKWGTLVVLSLALAIIIIDTTLLNVSLGPIIRDLKTDIQSIQWVITAYSLTLAALTITGGRLGDLFGRKKMFIAGAVIFAAGSFLASISHNVATMIIGESIIEGVGAALMMPATSSLLVSNFQGRERAIAFGVWGGIAAAASAIGPILGGYLATYFSWRWGFRINVLVAAILVVGSLIIKEAMDTEEKPTIDWLGVILSSTGLLSFVFGLIESSQYGWWTAKQAFVLFGTTLTKVGEISITPYALVLGVLLIAMFVWWERIVEKEGHTPLVSMKLFQNQQFASGAITTAALSLGLSGLIFSIPVFLQSVRNLTPLQTGLSLLPMSVTLLIVAPLSAVLSGKLRPKWLILTGMLLNVVAFIILRQSLSVDSTALTFTPGLVVFGIGMGLVMSQINNLTLSAVSVQQAGEASGVTNTLRQVGSSFGSAIIGAVLLTALSANLSNGILNSAKIPLALKPQLAKAVAEQTSNVEFGGGAQTSGSLPPVITTEIITIGHQATVDANKKSLSYGIIFAILGLLTAFWLPNTMLSHAKKETVAAGH